MSEIGTCWPWPAAGGAVLDRDIQRQATLREWHATCYAPGPLERNHMAACTSLIDYTGTGVYACKDTVQRIVRSCKPIV